MVSSFSIQSDCALTAWKIVSIPTDQRSAKRVLNGTASWRRAESWQTCRGLSQFLRKRKISGQGNAENLRALCANPGSGQVFNRRSANAKPGGPDGDQALRSGNAFLLKQKSCSFLIFPNQMKSLPAFHH